MSALLTPEEIDALLHGFDVDDLVGTGTESRKAPSLASPGAKARKRVAPPAERVSAGGTVATGS